MESALIVAKKMKNKELEAQCLLASANVSSISFIQLSRQKGIMDIHFNFYFSGMSVDQFTASQHN